MSIRADVRGIRTRHYAVNDQGMTVMLNEELAAHAAIDALRDRGLPVSAVRNHVQNTLGKLHLHNRVELVRYAIEHGLAGESG